jgi:hypothetical protein
MVADLDTEGSTVAMLQRLLGKAKRTTSGGGRAGGTRPTGAAGRPAGGRRPTGGRGGGGGLMGTVRGFMRGR